ncbi:YfhD family protein [Thalassobacillus sp. B23F22_16]|uniref:YfhD family protein n=1 Tax=Thalassobacillus sp. B23F22_16 TaxID=3459513 RepID=UPI00373E140C
MGRDDHRKANGKNDSSLPQTPKYEKKAHALDIEFSEELADHEDREAQARSQAADARMKNKD